MNFGFENDLSEEEEALATEYFNNLDRNQIKPLLLIPGFNNDFSFFNGLVSRLEKKFQDIHYQYDKVVTEHCIPSFLFKANKYYDTETSKPHLTLMTNENALSDAIASAFLYSEYFWKAFYKLVVRDESESVPSYDTIKVRREKPFYETEQSNTPAVKGSRRGRGDIYISFLNNDRRACFFIEHKVDDVLKGQQVGKYCDAAKYERGKERGKDLYFVVITSKDKDFECIDKQKSTIMLHFGRKPVLIRHVDLMKALYTELNIERGAHYTWLITWLFEIVKQYVSQKCHRDFISANCMDKNLMDPWDKSLLLEILGEDYHDKTTKRAQ